MKKTAILEIIIHWQPTLPVKDDSSYISLQLYSDYTPKVI